MPSIPRAHMLAIFNRNSFTSSMLQALIAGSCRRSALGTVGCLTCLTLLACPAQPPETLATPTLEPTQALSPTPLVSLPVSLTWQAPLEVGQGRSPFALLLGTTAHLFLTQQTEGGGEDLVTRRLDMQTGTLEPAITIKGAASVPYAVFHNQIIHLTATDSRNVHYLTSPDLGLTWSLQGSVVRTNDPYLCTTLSPSLPVFDADDQLQLALAYAYNDHLFGCSDQAWRSSWDGKAWSTPVYAGRGAPTGLAYLADRTVYATTFGLWRSEDDATFTELSGDTTQAATGSDGMTRRGDGSFLLSRAYGYANLQSVGLVWGDAAGEDWESPYSTVFSDTRYSFTPRVAAEGQTVVSAWLWASTGEILGSYYRNEAMAAVSGDGGLTFSEASLISSSSPGEQVDELWLARDGSRLLAVYRLTDTQGLSKVYAVRGTLLETTDPG